MELHVFISDKVNTIFTVITCFADLPCKLAAYQAKLLSSLYSCQQKKKFRFACKPKNRFKQLPFSTDKISV